MAGLGFDRLLEFRLKETFHQPQKYANELESKGFPAKAILNATLDAAEKVGYKWPVRYVIK